MDQKQLIIITLIGIWIIVGILELIVIYIYLTSKNKTSYEDEACILTIFKSIINILNGIYFWYIFYKEKKENIYSNTLKLINIIIYIIGLIFCSNIKKYGIFIYVIILEVSLYLVTIIFILLLCLFLKKSVLINTPQIVTHDDNIEIVNINIPQIAVPANNIELVDVNIPHATPITFNN